MAEQMAHDLRLPIVRIIEGSGGGGSVKTIETTGRANLPGRVGSNLPYYYTTTNLGAGAGRRARARLGRRARRGAAGGEPLLGDDQGNLGAVRRRPAGGRRADRPAASTKLRARRLGDPDALRRRRSRGRYRGRGLRVHAALPVLSAVVGVRVAAARPRPTTPSGGTSPCSRRSRATAARSTRCGPIVEAVVDKGTFFEMGRMFGRGMITGLARLDGLPVAVMASDPFFYARRMDGRCLRQDHPLRRPRRDLSPADRLSVRLPRLSDRAGGREGRDDPQGRARDGGGQPVERAVVHLHRAQRRSASPARSTSRRAAFRSAMPGCRRAGARCRWRAASRPPTAPRSTPRPTATPRSPRSRSGCNILRSPFRTAETFWVEEIIDPRDTRPLLCDFARLAEPCLERGRALQDTAVETQSLQNRVSAAQSFQALARWRPCFYRDLTGAEPEFVSKIKGRVLRNGAITGAGFSARSTLPDTCFTGVSRRGAVARRCFTGCFTVQLEPIAAMESWAATCPLWCAKRQRPARRGRPGADHHSRNYTLCERSCQ